MEELSVENIVKYSYFYESQIIQHLQILVLCFDVTKKILGVNDILFKTTHICCTNTDIFLSS
jgi:hypothetical protein